MNCLVAGAVGELVDRFQRHFGHFQGDQPLGLLVLDVLAAFDGEEEIFGEALFDDLLGRFLLAVVELVGLLQKRPSTPREMLSRLRSGLNCATATASPGFTNPGGGLRARSAIFSTRLILPTTSRVWALS